MKIKISELKEKIQTYLQTIGLNEHDREVLTELVVEQELIGNRFSRDGEDKATYDSLCGACYMRESGVI